MKDNRNTANIVIHENINFKFYDRITSLFKKPSFLKLKHFPMQMFFFSLKKRDENELTTEHMTKTQRDFFSSCN